jgi:uncharacterized protein (DUF885 family)
VVALHDSGEDVRSLNILHSPLQMIRQVFDVMNRSDDADWEVVATRMEKVGLALSGFRASIAEAIQRKVPPCRRQVLACARQAARWSGADGERSYFDVVVAEYAPSATRLGERLSRAAEAASAAYAETARWLRDDVSPRATERDAAGPERYALWSRAFLAAVIDPVETYLWGWSEVHRIEQEMRDAASAICDGSVAEAVELMNSDPSRAAQGEEALCTFLQQLMDRTITELDGTHFDIAGPLKRVEQMIAPPGGAAAPHYTPPSEDLSRPGRAWYPTLGKTAFPLWGEVTTCYHEGVPGHHLQLGQVICLRDELSRFQRTTFLSGHGEGWALYAERFMDELGKFELPDYRMGYLRSQLMRALRVVVDIGMHLELEVPADERFHPEERWSPALGEELLMGRSYFPSDFMASELDRYLGMPGQAISYKVGERAWLTARDRARQAAGPTFDLKAFHTWALGLGPIGLDQLVAECERAGGGCSPEPAA